MAILPNGTLEYYEKGEINAAALLEQGVKDSFSFRPLLVKDGKSMLDEAAPSEYTMRVAFGYSDPYHYITLVGMRDRLNQLTHIQTAGIMLHYGAKLAYNLDGGHSTSLCFMGRELSMMSLTGIAHRNIRALSDIVIFLENPSVMPEEEKPADELPPDDETTP
jgi:exopolysaccharide biosynthesis protein